jgi:hypothetical protein
MKPTIEYVTGDHWIGSSIETKRTPAESHVEIVEDIFLDLGVSAPAVMLRAHIVSGGISRLCLVEDTVFQGKAPKTFLTVPSGIDIFESLSRGSKESVWVQVQEQMNG